MKTEDFNRLKEICEKEGFEVELSSPLDQTYRIFKKDPWEGVEFASFGEIHKIKSFEDDIITFNHSWAKKEICKPSTEAAYIEQLKKTAYEKFGEIKEGDRFKSIEKELEIIIDYGVGFQYWKKDDRFLFNGWTIYQQGKWATKLPERVEVKLLRERYGNHPEFQFKIINGKVDYYDSYKIGEHLAKQLENYLNDETKTRD